MAGATGCEVGKVRSVKPVATRVIAAAARAPSQDQHIKAETPVRNEPTLEPARPLPPLKPLRSPEVSSEECVELREGEPKRRAHAGGGADYDGRVAGRAEALRLRREVLPHPRQLQ